MPVGHIRAEHPAGEAQAGRELVAQGLASREGAIQAGITIEQTDIADLNARVSTAPADVERVLESLLRGSENHLAAFERQA
jgi:hypothetical protein